MYCIIEREKKMRKRHLKTYDTYDTQINKIFKGKRPYLVPQQRRGPNLIVPTPRQAQPVPSLIHQGRFTGGSRVRGRFGGAEEANIRVGGGFEPETRGPGG